jgi:hypothetical protein
MMVKLGFEIAGKKLYDVACIVQLLNIGGMVA